LKERHINWNIATVAVLYQSIPQYLKKKQFSREGILTTKQEGTEPSNFIQTLPIHHN